MKREKYRWLTDRDKTVLGCFLQAFVMLGAMVGLIFLIGWLSG